MNNLEHVLCADCLGKNKGCVSSLCRPSWVTLSRMMLHYRWGWGQEFCSPRSYSDSYSLTRMRWEISPWRRAWQPTGLAEMRRTARVRSFFAPGPSGSGKRGEDPGAALRGRGPGPGSRGRARGALSPGSWRMLAHAGVGSWFVAVGARRDDPDLVTPRGHGERTA